jgi:hypothetical protein
MIIVLAVVLGIVLVEIMGTPWASWLNLVVYILLGALVLSVAVMLEDVAPRRVDIRSTGVDFIYFSKKVDVSWANLRPARARPPPLTNLVPFVVGSEDRVWPNYLWVTKTQAAVLTEAIQASHPMMLTESST